jgi:hypothetical protein
MEFGSKEYRAALEKTAEAINVQNRRNRFTTHMKRKGTSPFDTEPPKPTQADMAKLNEYRDQMLGLKGHTDQWWFKRIDAAIEEKFYRSFLHQLIWWDRCEDEDLDDAAWKLRFKDWDFGQALTTDWDLIEYGLHCCGYPPFKAHGLAFQCRDRKKWLATKKRKFICFECDHMMTNLDRVPTKCRSCHTVGSIEELV